MPYIQIFPPELAETPMAKIIMFISDDRLLELADVIEKQRNAGFIINIFP
jgi:hypothetical protein